MVQVKTKDKKSRQRIFGKRRLPDSSADIIHQMREERAKELD